MYLKSQVKTRSTHKLVIPCPMRKYPFQKAFYPAVFPSSLVVKSLIIIEEEKPFHFIHLLLISK
ncbi:MAG: hypothetical protein M1421_00785 [Candidatus Eremiobacteraeota bacterium]|nr:hypothetical protein [Candidatus Eremiobacteraeota bacterium]